MGREPQLIENLGHRTCWRHILQFRPRAKCHAKAQPTLAERPDRGRELVGMDGSRTRRRRGSWGGAALGNGRWSSDLDGAVERTYGQWPWASTCRDALPCIGSSKPFLHALSLSRFAKYLVRAHLLENKVAMHGAPREPFFLLYFTIAVRLRDVHIGSLTNSSYVSWKHTYDLFQSLGMLYD
jgi:hypothetical protein